MKFKLAVNSEGFPFLYNAAGRATLLPGLDIGNRMPGNFAGNAESHDYNTIQLLYAENVLPTPDGLISVGVTDYIAAEGTATTFDRIMLLRDEQESAYLYSPAGGDNWVYKQAADVWYSSYPLADVEDKRVTQAFVNGNTYTFFEGTKALIWNSGSEELEDFFSKLPEGYTVDQIRYVCAASNYIVICTDTEILWSSLVDVTDFDDRIGGAGRQIPVDLRGRITAILPIAGGFIIYTSRNAVAAYHTSNAESPFLFREILGAGGVSSPEQVTHEANAKYHYTYGTSGLQRVTLDAAETIQPALADFLRGKTYNKWNASTKQIDTVLAAGVLDVRLQYLLNRYLMISYAKEGDHFQFVLVYDDVLNRWGKIRVEHIDCCLLPLEIGQAYQTYESLDPQTYEDLGDTDYADFAASSIAESSLIGSIGFLKNTGQIQVLVTDPASDAAAGGVAVYGHIQLVRDRWLTLQEVEIDSAVETAAPTVYVLPSNDGKTRQAGTQLTFFEDSWLGAGITAKNLDLAVTGNFFITTIIAEATPHGKR